MTQSTKEKNDEHKVEVVVKGVSLLKRGGVTSVTLTEQDGRCGCNGDCGCESVCGCGQ